MTAWHDDDGFWAAIEPALFSERRLAAAPGDVASIAALIGLKPGDRVLDLCTGPGRHATELARRGCKVTAVDRTAAYLERAEEKARRAEVEIEFVQADMREFVRPQAFDAIVNLYTSFGYFDDQADNLRVLANARESLVPGGALLIEMIGKETVAMNGVPRTWIAVDDLVVCEERIVADGWDRVETLWVVMQRGQRRTIRAMQRIYAATEMRAMLHDAGFGEVSIYGNLDGAPYDRDAKRMVAVAR